MGVLGRLSSNQKLSLAKEKLSCRFRKLDGGAGKDRKSKLFSFRKKKSGSVSTTSSEPDVLGSEQENISLPSETKSSDEQDAVDVPLVSKEVGEITPTIIMEDPKLVVQEEETLEVIESNSSISKSSLANVAFQIFIAIAILASLIFAASITTDHVDVLTDQVQQKYSVVTDQVSITSTQLQGKANELWSVLGLGTLFKM